MRSENIFSKQNTQTQDICIDKVKIKLHHLDIGLKVYDNNKERVIIRMAIFNFQFSIFNYLCLSTCPRIISIQTKNFFDFCGVNTYSIYNG
jgi:hypothetical protein